MTEEYLREKRCRLCLEALENEVILDFLCEVYDTVGSEVLEEIVLESLTAEVINSEIEGVVVVEFDEMKKAVRREQDLEDKQAYEGIFLFVVSNSILIRFRRMYQTSYSQKICAGALLVES
jgi:hypothetical protein